MWEGESLQVGCSIGVAFWPEDADEMRCIDGRRRCGDVSEKAEGRGRIVFYAESKGESNEHQEIRVGFIGLGVMGRPMALRLLRAGHQVAVWSASCGSAGPLVEAGATACADPAAVARHSEVVLRSLPTAATSSRSCSGSEAWPRAWPPEASSST